MGTHGGGKHTLDLLRNHTSFIRTFHRDNSSTPAAGLPPAFVPCAQHTGLYSVHGILWTLARYWVIAICPMTSCTSTTPHPSAHPHSLPPAHPLSPPVLHDGGPCVSPVSLAAAGIMNQPLQATMFKCTYTAYQQCCFCAMLVKGKASCNRVLCTLLQNVCQQGM